jgi:hypothetical protein
VAARLALDRFDHRSEERVGNVGDDESQVAGPARRETARHRVRLVTQRFGCGKDAAPGIVSHHLGADEHAGDRGG